MKNILKFMLLGVIMVGTLAFSGLARADARADDRVTVTGLATGSGVAQATQTRSDSSACALGSGSAQGIATGGAQVTREPNALTIVGVGSGAAGVDTNRVQGSTTGSGLVMLRISWGGHGNSSDRSGVSSPTASNNGRGGASDRGRGVASPPGAPEMPGDVMFGSGFLVLGFGLLLYRRRIW